MGVVHLAYTFNPEEFHSSLEQAVVENGTVSQERFLRYVKHIVSRASRDTKDALDTICFDEEWFDISDSEIHHNDDWYLVALTGFLRASVRLSNLSFAYLELTLPILNWSAESVRLLLAGQFLRILIKSSENEALVKSCLGQRYEVTWLGLESIMYLSTKLTACEREFGSANIELLNAIAILPSQFAQNRELSGILKQAYAEVYERLQTATRQGHALLLMNDVTSYRPRHQLEPI